MLLSDVCLMSIRYMASASSASLVDMYIRHRSLQFHNMVVLGGGHTLGILRFAVSFLQVVEKSSFLAGKFEKRNRGIWSRAID